MKNVSYQTLEYNLLKFCFAFYAVLYILSFMTLIANVQPDSGCESEASNAGHWRTSMVRFEHEPQSVKLFADPQSGLIYGRNQLRSSHHYQ